MPKTHQIMDQLIRFSLANATVRGGIVRLDQTVQEAQKRRRYPAPILTWLSESMAASALIATNIQFRGKLTLQIQCDGPIKLLVTEVTDQLGIRATAHWDNPLPETLDFTDYFGRGHLALTLNFADSQEFYQGITGLQSEGFIATLEHYFLHSEQLETKLWLQSNGRQAAGLLLQKIPSAGGEPSSAEVAQDHWETAQALANTLRPQELLTHNAEDILHKLFATQQLTCQASKPTYFFCSCSPDRVAGILKLIGEAEVQSILEEQGQVAVSCDFCGQPYLFNQEQALAALAEQASVEQTKAQNHTTATLH